jgi:hypothetical protein
VKAQNAREFARTSRAPTLSGGIEKLNNPILISIETVGDEPHDLGNLSDVDADLFAFVLRDLSR